LTLPDTMRAIEITQPGGPQVLQQCERAVPIAGHGEALIEVVAAGVNRPDCLQRTGGYPPPHGVTDIPGLEVSGTVVSKGDMEGKRVMALVPGGGYGEYVTAPMGSILEIPASLSFDQAAAIPETYFTVWHNVFQRGRLKQGETLLVHGGTSGIGTTAIQLAKHFGAQVITTAGSNEKCEACLRLGADRAVNYKQEAFEDAVADFTDGKGADLILDMVGGSYIERNYECAAMDGRIVQIAFLGGAKVEVNFAKLMLKRLIHTGSTLRARSPDFKASIASDLKRSLMAQWQDGKLLPVMDSTFALAQAARAHAHMEESNHIGKIVLTVKS